jgi:hypothetical protein
VQVTRLGLDNALLSGIALAGSIAAGMNGEPGFVVLFVVIGVVVAVRLLPTRRRRPLAVRADLAAWLDEVSATSGEPIEVILDRSVSAYRAGMCAGDAA